MHFLVRVFFLAIVLLPAVFGFAQTTKDYVRPGLYLGGGGIYAVEDFNNSSVPDFKNAPGFNFRLGYRLNSRVAIEAMGERSDAFDLQRFRLPRFSSYEINTWTGTLNGKFFALTGRFQPYGLIGVGAMQAESKFNKNAGFAARFGGGMDSYLTENWLINMEFSYVLPTGDVENLNYFSLGGGIQYRF